MATGNQIEYLKFRETQRNNVVTAEEQGRHNKATEGLEAGKLRETERHQREMERQGDQKLSNDYELGKGNLIELGRHNVVTEGIANLNLQETARANKAKEKNQRYATNKSYSSSIKSSQISARASKSNAKTAASASKYAAQTSANASKYNADVKAASDAAERANKSAINAANNKTSKAITKMNNDAKLALKELDRLMNNDNLTQKEKSDLRSAKTAVKTAIIAGDAKTMSSVLGSIRNAVSKLSLKTLAKKADEDTSYTPSSKGGGRFDEGGQNHGKKKSKKSKRK